MVKKSLIIIGVIIIIITLIAQSIFYSSSSQQFFQSENSKCNNWISNLFGNDQTYCNQVRDMSDIIGNIWIGYIFGIFFIILGLVLERKNRIQEVKEYKLPKKDLINEKSVFLNSFSLKNKKNYQELLINYGNPKDLIKTIINILENLGFKTKNEGASIEIDEVENNIKNFEDNIEARRKNINNNKVFKILYLISIFSAIIITIIFGALVFLELIHELSLLGFISLIVLSWIIVLIFALFSQDTKRDFIWIKIEGKIYTNNKVKSNTLSRVNSKIKIMVAGDSEFNNDKLRDEITTILNNIKNEEKTKKES